VPRTISFIVPAHNEEQLLGRTLASLHAAATDVADPESIRYEVIVVDDDSDDRTAALAAAAGARVVSVRCRQIAGARNAGARVAVGDVFIFVDADTTVGADTLRATLRSVDRGCVGGGALLQFDDPVPFAARIVSPILALTMRLSGLAAGAYVFCTRSAFEAVGGFDETLFATEELTLSRALRRIGRTEILRERVVTSGRKARTHSTRELLAPILAFLRHGPGARRRRDQLDLWYGRRRTEPHLATSKSDESAARDTASPMLDCREHGRRHVSIEARPEPETSEQDRHV
jgi:GT2 family glycosyltransferase